MRRNENEEATMRLAFLTACASGLLVAAVCPPNSAQVAARLAQGDHIIHVFWKIANNTGFDLNGYLQNWSLTILEAE
jgi:hypothetical protein